MRLVPAVAVAMIVAAPAAAQERRAPPPRLNDVGAALSNPLVQDGLAAMVANVADAVLATHVGPVARLADPDDDVRPSDTLADLAARRDPDYREHLRERTRASVAAVGETAHDVAATAAELRATTARVRAALAPALAALDSLDRGAADRN